MLELSFAGDGSAHESDFEAWDVPTAETTGATVPQHASLDTNWSDSTFSKLAGPLQACSVRCHTAKTAGVREVIVQSLTNGMMG